MEKGYIPTPEEIEALNEAGYLHGTAYIPGVSNEDLARQEELYGFQKFDDTGCLNSFGGLYVSTSRNTAKIAADTTKDYLQSVMERHYKATPIIAKITFLPESEIAIDEDFLGWGEACIRWENEYRFSGWLAARSPFSDCLEAVDLLDSFNLELEAIIRDDVDDDSSGQPEDYRDEIDTLSLAYAGPAIKGWIKLLKNPLRFNPDLTLRILNNKFIADPPLVFQPL